MKGIDHLVLCVQDLDKAASFYEQLGFTVTPQGQHPFGTANRLVQLDGVFLEILTVNQPENIPAPERGQFSFARFNQKFLARREGFSMLVLDSEDARADHAKAVADGLQTWPPFEFSRQAKLPSGDSVTVSFGLNFVTHPQIPDAAFFTCRQFNPEYFWKPEYQAHTNTATSVGEVWLVAENPNDFSGFVSAFADSAPTTGTLEKVVVPTARGDIIIAKPEMFAERFETTASELSDGPRLAGFTISVDDLSKVESQTISASDAFGVAIRFEKA